MMHSGITVEVLRDPSAIGALRPVWQALFKSCEAEPSTSIEWTMALLDSHLREGDVTLTFVFRRAGTIIAIVPLLFRRDRLIGPLRIATVCLLSELDNTHSDILGERDNPAVMAALFDALAALPESWDVFQVGRLLTAGPLEQGMSGFLADGRWRFRRRREQPSFLLDLNGTYEDFLRNRSSKFRNYLRRKARALEALGSIRIAQAGRQVSVEDAYKDLLQVEKSSWKHQHGTAISAVAHRQGYYRSLCEELSRKGALHLTVMYIDERPVAYNLGLVHRRRYYYLKTSYDMALRTASPATVFRARLIEMLISEGVTSMDFPAEPYQWEEQWTKDMRWHESIVVFNRSMRARTWSALFAARDAIKPRPQNDRIEYVNPRALRAP